MRGWLLSLVITIVPFEWMILMEVEMEFSDDGEMVLEIAQTSQMVRLKLKSKSKLEDESCCEGMGS